MFFLYVRPQDWVPGIIGLPTANIVVPVGIVVGLLKMEKNAEPYWFPQAWLFAIYLSIIFISSFFAVGYDFAWQQFVLFFKRVTIFLMIILIVNTEKRIRIVIIAMLLLSLFLAYQAFLQAHTGYSWGGMTPYPGYAEIRVRWYGDWDGPNVFALLFVMAFAVVIEFLLGPYSILTRIGAAMGLSVYLLAIYYTNSRGALLAVATTVAFYIRARFSKKILAVIGVLCILLIVGLAPSEMGRLGQINSSEASASERTWLWEQGLNMLRAHPLLGVGRGRFAENVDLRLIAHNNFVQNFAELGLSGFFCFCSILWFSFKGSVMVEKCDALQHTRLPSFGRMMSTLLIGYCATTFFVVMELDLFYFVLGLSGSVYLTALRENKEVKKIYMSNRDVQIILVGMAGIIFMVWLASVKHIL